MITHSLPTRPAGSTGRSVSRLTVGGVKWDSRIPEAEAIDLLTHALERGVTSFDTAHAYGGGESERRLGLALQGRFSDVFVSTKITDRTRQGAKDQLRISLERLGTDHVDLVYVHSLEDDGDFDRVTGEDGPLRALRECREEGLLDFIGVSGHWYRDNMRRLIDVEPLDALLFPVGLFNRAYGHDYTSTVLPAARAKGIATFGMKVLGAGRAQHVADIGPYLRYSLQQPIDSLVIGCDSRSQLDQLVEIIVSEPPSLSDAQCDALAEECRRVTQDWDKGEFNWVSHYKETGPLAAHPPG